VELTKKHIEFIEGPIHSTVIEAAVKMLGERTDIGAHNLFLGQIRADEIDGKPVEAIDYSAYQEMAEKQLHKIADEALKEFPLQLVQIYHSMGAVKKGEISLFVLVASKHRKPTFTGLWFVVEEIKANVPIFGKEVFGDDSYVWKENKG
jgi:molybdopterin synthase catalytic subunit